MKKNAYIATVTFDISDFFLWNVLYLKKYENVNTNLV